MYLKDSDHLKSGSRNQMELNFLLVLYPEDIGVGKSLWLLILLHDIALQSQSVLYIQQHCISLFLNCEDNVRLWLAKNHTFIVIITKNRNILLTFRMS